MASTSPATAHRAGGRWPAHHRAPSSHSAPGAASPRRWSSVRHDLGRDRDGTRWPRSDRLASIRTIGGLMKRRLVVVAALIVVAAIVGVWRMRGGSAVRSGGPRAESSGSTAASSLSDPRTLARGSISGTVRDEAKAPVARATVCASASSRRQTDALTRAPLCTSTDDQGRYQLGNLLPADYTVGAGAPRFRPAAFSPSPGQDRLR